MRFATSAMYADVLFPSLLGAYVDMIDLGLAQQAAAGLGRDLPMLGAVHGQMRAAVEAGGASRDWSVMAAHTLRELDAG